MENLTAEEIIKKSAKFKIILRRILWIGICDKRQKIRKDGS